MRALALAAAIALIAPAARTQDATAEARTLFEAGIHQFEDNRYAEAVASFDRSLALRESPAVLYNLGLALRGTGSYRRAISVFERFLMLAQPQDAQRRDAQAIVNELHDALAVVELTVRGGASEVRIDGVRSPNTDGTMTLMLDPGAHAVEAQREGYRLQRRALSLTSGAHETVVLDASDDPLPAMLRVDCDDPDAEILLDGEPFGRGVQARPVTAGDHEITVRTRDHEAHRRRVHVEPGSAPRVSFALLARSSSGSVLTRWWFWTGAAAVAAGLVVGAVLLFSGTEDPVAGTWGTAFNAVLSR